MYSAITPNAINVNPPSVITATTTDAHPAASIPRINLSTTIFKAKAILQKDSQTSMDYLKLENRSGESFFANTAATRFAEVEVKFLIRP